MIETVWTILGFISWHSVRVVAPGMREMVRH